jgi:hypothetical protein
MRPFAIVCVMMTVAIGSSCARAGQTVELFNGKDLTGWKGENFTKRHLWTVGTASVAGPKKLAVTPGGSELILPEFGSDLVSDQTFSDIILELDVMIPPASNSGIYLMGEYELQIIDDAAAPADTPPDMKHGSISRVSRPKAAASPTPGSWQTIRVEFRAPRFDAQGKKTAPATFQKVTIDGKVVQENATVPESTLGARTFEEKPAGPLMLQGAEGGVAYRNIRITPLD